MDIENIIIKLDKAYHKKCKIVVAGDFCLDKYLYVDGSLDERSLETGKTAYQVTHRALFPGAAGTIVNNLSALGVPTVCVGFIGEDGEGWELERALLKTGTDTSYLIRTSDICTPTYTKPVYKKQGELPFEMNRFDLRNFSRIPDLLEQKLIENIEYALAECEAMIICDQFIEADCSAITSLVRKALCVIAEKNPDKMILADSRGFINSFRGVTIKCNDKEVASGFSLEEGALEDTELICEYGKKLCERNGKSAVITCGSKGSWFFGEDGSYDYCPSFKIEGPIDICGAGDSFNAGFVFGITAGLSPAQALAVGNAVASITIQQIGVTGTATITQLFERLRLL